MKATRSNIASVKKACFQSGKSGGRIFLKIQELYYVERTSFTEYYH